MILFSVDGGGDQQKGSMSVRGTGWAAFRIEDESLPVLEQTGLIQGGPDNFLHDVMSLGSDAGMWLREAGQVVVENFVLINSRAKIDPLEIVGMMRMWCAIKHVPCAVQMPGARKMVSHSDLRRIGMWPGGAGHADEAQAVRHGLTWAMLNGHRPTIELLHPDVEEDEGEERSPSSW